MSEPFDREWLAAVLKSGGYSHHEVKTLLSYVDEGIERDVGSWNTKPPETGRPAQSDARENWYRVCEQLKAGDTLKSAFAIVAEKYVGPDETDVDKVKRHYHEQKRQLKKWFESLE